MQIGKVVVILGLQCIVSVQCGLISTQSLNLDAFVGRVSLCPEGSTTIQGTTVTTVSDCVCLPGHYPSNNHCILCPAHTYKSATDNTTCLDCPIDSVASPGSSTQSMCLCSAGFGYSAGICVACSKGKFKSYHDNSVCPNCPPHSNTINTGTNDVFDCLCDTGYYGSMNGASLFQNSIDWASVQCNACPVGKFKDVTGSTDNGLTDASCSTCNPFSTSLEASVSNTDCQCLPGYTGPNGGPCVACDAGTYKISTGPEACTSCHANSNSPSGFASASACICNVGHTGSGECNACDVDTYKSLSGNQACTACPENTVSATGSTLLNNCSCAPGFHGTNTACTSCPPDYYCTGGSNLTPCPGNSSSPMYSFQEEDCVCLGGFEKETSL